MTRILILGAGCTGLGAAYRLCELGHTEFLILEKNHWPGGLAASFTDPHGFTWDIGGHVGFSRIPYFRDVMQATLPDGWIDHSRQSHIWMRGRFVPYPLQNNLRLLPKPDLLQCLLGLLARPQPNGPAPNYRQWAIDTFGSAISSLFLLPYSEKVWAWPPAMLSTSWVTGRVAPVDLPRLLETIILEQDDVDWGANRTFRVPACGGNGAVWRKLAAGLPAGSIRYGMDVACIESSRRVVITTDGAEHPYDVLISSLPLGTPAGTTRHSGVHVVGIGLRGRPPASIAERNWMYFPESDCPFYRVTVLSNYSPYNAPAGHWSLLAEVSSSPYRPVDPSTVVRDTVAGMRNTRLLGEGDEIVSTWHHYAPYAYPTPTVDRDEIVSARLRELEARDIYSRGRFGAWKYEVGNQDHSFMQGVEVVNRILRNEPETTLWASQ